MAAGLAIFSPKIPFPVELRFGTAGKEGIGIENVAGDEVVLNVN